MIPLTETQSHWQAKVRQFCLEKVAPTVIERDKQQLFDHSLVKDVLALGLSRIYWPTTYGGFGDDFMSYAVALKELAKFDDGLAITVSVCVGLCCESIASFGTEQQKEKFLNPLIAGETIGAFALTEKEAGTDASGVQTTAVRDGEYYILNGEKVYITNAGEADVYIVFAMTDPEAGAKGISAFIVTKDMVGFTTGPRDSMMGLHTSTCGSLRFENVRVPVANLLGREGEGYKIAMRTLDSSRIGVAAQATGLAEAALAHSIAYTKERVQFGKPLSKFQNTQFQLAQMAIQVEAANLMLYNVAQDKSEGRPYTVSASMAKKFCSDVAMEVTTKAVQLFGGYGYCEDYPVARLMRNAKVTQIYEGTNEAQQMVIGGALLR
ncbi:acyl-CoA dehydrogenase family protein [Veillonella criceti]|uniref:Acyl-CoA dehydrogenase, short-chain specific n=1 Tax=Veillonella criceti TaxID=103891 RepID=A0A380NGA1_9FIRM|nr:acyl-CoA dehydrogenase family protein [Veillonella criceti]SUP39694.1 Acyl-CoA dehydrogenase, short-chain specific [Veillonella criceti]